MVEGEPESVQALPPEGGSSLPHRLGRGWAFAAGAAVELVAEERPAGVGEVGADLVRAAREKFHVEPGGKGRTRQHGKARHRAAAGADLRRKALPVGRVARDQSIELARIRRRAVHQRAIPLLHAARLELRLQRAQCRLGLCHHQTA